MLHPKYLKVDSQVEIPELSGYIQGSTLFKVMGVFAGGMGVCVHLHHIETGMQFALKGVRPDHMSDQDSVDRFLDELRVWLSASMCSLVAEAIAVVRINETPCVLAAWMPKGDLATALPGLTRPNKFEVLVRIVRGLSWVRDNLGVIHRDLKPANVLLDKDSLAYVADWGLARPIGSALASVGASLSTGMLDRLGRTQAGSFLGTVTYAAPEQILGASDIDHRADIYALGCMMFEFETGSPPFKGQTVAEIARQHIQTPPPKLGGWFKSTELGLGEIISKCLEKKPGARFSSYAELDHALTAVARKKGIALDRCVAMRRYERAPLGEGHLKQAAVLGRAPAQGKGEYELAEYSDIFPFLEEANNLMALKRYTEAELLLRPHFLPTCLDFHSEWIRDHSVALNYACCLLPIGRQDEAMEIWNRLNSIHGKTAEFYVNYSLALLHQGKWSKAKDVCLRGLRHYPSDPDILGNQTIALLNNGELDGAKQSVVQRLSTRRDIHGIEEAVGVLHSQAKARRDADLPAAIANAKLAGDLIKEGLALNPRFYTLRIAEIQLRRFACDEAKVLDLYQAMMDADDSPVLYRQLAFAEMAEKLAEGKQFKTALGLLQRSGDILSERLETLKMRILARRYMIGLNNSAGQKILIPEVRDYFLEKSETKPLRDPVIAAEILEWMDDADGAISVLEQHLSKHPNNWEGIKAMALIYQRLGNNERALHFARLLTSTAPWRAESYDCLSYVAQRTNDAELARQAKQRGDEVFNKESTLFDDLRAHLDA
jgi:tetratricopeptide (TPR) repeat protein